MKESYRNKIASLNNPTSNELGLSLEIEIGNALKHLLEKTKNQHQQVADQKRIINTLGWYLPCFYLNDTSTSKIPQILPTSYIIKNDTAVRVVYGYYEWNNQEIIAYLDPLAR